MDGEITRDVFLRQLRHNVAALKESPALASPRLGLPSTSEEQLTLLKEQRVRSREAQLTTQLHADLQRSQAEYSDVLRASTSATGDAVDLAPAAKRAAEPRSDVEARRYVTAPLLSLLRIFMRRQRVANRLACLESQQAQQRKLERATVSTTTETEVVCGVTGAGPFAVLPSSDANGENATWSAAAGGAAGPSVDMPNHHCISLRPPQPLRKPLAFRQAHYRVEPFPEFSLDIHAESERELDAYRATRHISAETPSLQRFSQPLVTMEMFAPSSTYNFGPVNIYGNSEYRAHALSENGSHLHAEAARSRITARAQAEAYLAPSSITVDANLSSAPEKLQMGCAEDSVSDDDQYYVSQGCVFQNNPTWLPSRADTEHLDAGETTTTTNMMPPSTFVSFLDKFT